MNVKHDPVARAVREAYPYEVDLENCDVEPLRHIQVVQPFACLLAADRQTLRVHHASENTEAFIGTPWQNALDQPLKALFGIEVMAQIAIGRQRPDGFETLNPIQSVIDLPGGPVLHNVIVHRSGHFLIVEVERVQEDLQTSIYQQLLARAVRQIQDITDYSSLFTRTALILQQLTGYNRVMVYRFDKDYNGEVIAEAVTEGLELESFHGLRYPHTDIPQQARELYLSNRVRLINDVGEPPARMRSGEAVTQEPLDLSMAGSRGCSPIHLEYLGYMGVNNSLSVAIVLEGKLWGLFAMHHYSPKQVDYATRNLLMFIGQIFSGHLSLQSAGRYRELTLTRNLVRLGIGEQIAKTRDVIEGLSQGRHTLLNIFPGTASGTISFEGRQACFGSCPPSQDVAALIDWIKKDERHDSQLVWHHESLGEAFEPFSTYCEDAAGALVIFLDGSRTDWICWFRPSTTRDIIWGGRPDKELIVAEDGSSSRLGPRRSFARYVETVEGCSAPWLPDEIDAAFALRTTIINGMVQHYAEIKKINERLQKAYEDLETFSYTVSHDLRAPLRAINGYTEILEEDYGHLLDQEGQRLIGGVQRGVEQMNGFITDILELSRVGSGGLKVTPVPVLPMVNELVEELQPIYGTSSIVVRVDPTLPAAAADPRLLRQLFMNLLTNAFKYLEPTPVDGLAVEIGYYPDKVHDRTIYTVTNTGPGIPEEYAKTIFEMFSRISSNPGTEGTGVGLAIVERIVERHGGEVWTSNDHLGVTFSFYLPEPSQPSA